MGRYDGKRVVITGGGGGIGLATARLLTAEGARVIVTGRTTGTLDAASAATGAVPVRADSTSTTDLDRLAARVGEEFGGLDALVISAGVNGFAPFEATGAELFDTVLGTNVKGAFFTVQRLAPLLAEGSGVVLITSVVNQIGYPNTAAFSASMAGLRSTARTLARELLPRGIRVNAVAPGPIDTGILEKTLPAEVAAQVRAQMSAESPMGRFGTPDEVARAAAFLAFDATFTTGAELVVDGGGTQI